MFLNEGIFLFCSVFLDGYLSNISPEKFHTVCAASTEFPTSGSILNFTCNNAQYPQWISYFEWSAICQPCTNQYIKFTFEQSYDIVEICLEQRKEFITHIVKKVTIELSNENMSSIELDQIDFQKCFLLTDDFGLDTKWLKVTIIDSFISSNNGMGSIMAYAYNRNIYTKLNCLKFNKLFIF